MARAPTGTAPPCTRRTVPDRSRTARSRRTVSVVTPNCSASAVTATRPRSATSPAMACCRSSGYTDAPPSMPGPVGFALCWCCSTSDPLTSQHFFVTLVTDGICTSYPKTRGEVPMSTTAPGTAALPQTGGPVVLPGTPVVPGVALGPVIRPSGAVQLPADDGAVVAEDRRPGEKERFVAAATVVADRLTERAAGATGVSAEVLAATAGLARD